MSAQTPQTDLLTLLEVLRVAIQRAEYAEQAEQDLERDLSHYKALCEELSATMTYLRISTERGGQWEQPNVNGILSAALKKAQKDI